MATINKDDLWKVLSVGISALILPLAGWVWSTNEELIEVQSSIEEADMEMERIQEKASSSDNNSKAIISIEKDIEYMKRDVESMRKSLERIEDSLGRK